MRLLALLLACLLFSASAVSAPASLRLVVLDVGEGEALLLQQGKQGFLIDSGHFGMGQRILQRLQHYGVETLSGIILTNLRPERAGGYFTLRQAYPEVTLYDNGQPLPKNIAPDSSRWLHQALQVDPHRQRLQQGESIQWRQLAINVLWPEGFDSNDINHHSLVLELSFAGRRVLVMSNVDAGVEQRLLARHLLPQQVDVLVVGYYGASVASSAEFLTQVQPAFAVISVDAENVRGFPSPAVVARLSQTAGEVLRTDLQGDVCLRISAERIRSCRGRD